MEIHWFFTKFIRVLHSFSRKVAQKMRQITFMAFGNRPTANVTNKINFFSGALSDQSGIFGLYNSNSNIWGCSPNPGVCVSSGRFVEIGRSKVVGLQVGISASANEVSSVRLKPGSQGWYEGISMNDWMKKWCVFYDSHWVTFVFAIQSAWTVSTGKEESTKEFEAGRWQLLELDHADPLSIRKKDWRRLI